VGFHCTSLNRGVEHRAALNVGHTSSVAHHDDGPEQRVLPGDLADEVAQHRLGDEVVGDDAVAHRTADDDAAWRSPEHLSGVRAYGDNTVVCSRVGHHRRLVEDNALALDVHQHVGCAKIYADVLRKHHAGTAGSVSDVRATVYGAVGPGSGRWGPGPRWRRATCMRASSRRSAYRALSACRR